MKTFLVLLKEKSTKPLNQTLLNDHVKHLKQLNKQGCLLICGPFSDDSGAMLVIQATSHYDADQIIQADPLIQDGFYGGYTISEFFKADESNDYLMEHDQTIGELNRQ